MNRQNCQITYAENKPLVTATHFFSTQWSNCESTKVTRIRIRPQHHEWVDKLGSSHRSGRFFLPILRFSLSSKTKTWLDLILFVVNTCTHLTRRHIGSDCYASLLIDEITSWTIYVDKYTTIFPSNNNNEHSLLSVEEIRNTQKLQLHSIELETHATCFAWVWTWQNIRD